MTTYAPDAAARARVRGGAGFAVVSAASFGLSGALGSGLLDAGWSAGSAVTARVLLAAAILAVPAAVALRGRWGRLLDHLPLVVAYGLVAVAGCQLAYFNAVDRLEVGVALLIEYTAPVAVVGWLWARRGQRPGALTLAGAVVAAAGLALVLDVLGGARLDPLGVAWALGAMVGAAAYFLLSADDVGAGLPPVVLATAGLTVGGVALLAAGWVGLVPMAASAGDVRLAGSAVPWWLPVLGLGLVTAALAYVSGIAAVRRLGSRLASFAALTEVVFALVFAWLLLAELPGPLQLIGGVLILGGVVLVKLGERAVRRREPTPA